MDKDAMLSKSFHSHHSAWGSYFSFIIGKFGSRGGFVLNEVRPPYSNIYIGYKKGNSKPKLLPFFSKKNLDRAEKIYLNKNSNITVDWCRKKVETFKESKIQRTMNWSTESWRAEDLTMNIITPFDKIPDPKKMDKLTAKFYFCPAIFIQLEFNNSNCQEEMIGIFALQDMRRLLSDSTKGKLIGVAIGATHGFAVKPDNNINERLAVNIVESCFNDDKRNNRLGLEGGLSFKIPPKGKRKFTIALAAYVDGSVTAGIKSKFYYTEFFHDLEEVLLYALSNFDRYYKISLARDRELDSTNLNDYKKFMVSHFTKSYIANTELLLDENKEPLFVVNEGEYQMMNTLDLIVDQVFWEMYFSPWTVRNELESFLNHFQYEDYVLYENNKKKKGEISFCHDQGVANMFSSEGYSSYERGGLSICFSYMTHEEILNWLLTACIYGIIGNNTEWLKKHSAIFVKIFNSIVTRDENNDGIMDKDSSRCESGSEITTYDSLDVSLGQARNNLYLAVKTWAGYICLENIFRILNNKSFLDKAKKRSSLCASSIISKYDDKMGYIPAVFEKNNKSKIIPVIEGLIYPYIIGDINAVSFDGRFGDLIKMLKLHLENILIPGACINSKSGGWQLSSTSKNTWMSKIIINQYVAEKILKIENKDWEKWDKIHSFWQQKGCSFFAATDQINCDNGKDLGSRLYPRLVTSLLWMKY